MAPLKWYEQRGWAACPEAIFRALADGTLRCPAGHPLYPQERRPEGEGTLRVVYTARIGHCRPCPLRECCQGDGARTSKPRRVSAILHPSAEPACSQAPTVAKTGPAPILWEDWSRRLHRRTWIGLLHAQRVDVLVHPPPQAEMPTAPKLLSRAERAHWRLNWQERLACNARALAASPVQITLFGLPTGFAIFLGLPTRLPARS